jgi:hypothetical protein
MSTNSHETPAADDTPAPRAPWVTPVIAELPRLTQLTLSTPGVSGSGSGSSSVF